MGIQFIHVNTYGRSASNGKSHTIKSIRDEAMREPNATPHIENPSPDINELLYGQDLDSTIADAEKYAESMSTTFMQKQKDGTEKEVTRGMRKDGQVMMAGVFSAPSDMSDGHWNEYKQELINELREQFGDRLKTVIEHNDEPESHYRQSVERGAIWADQRHRHCHFYVVPRPGERMDEVHPGHAAARIAKDEGKLKGEQNQAYKAGMREWQDKFYDISRKYALARLGPQRQRLDRPTWKAQKEQLLIMSKMLKDAEAAQKLTDKMIADAESKAAEIIEKADASVSVKIAEANEKAASAESVKQNADAYAKRVRDKYKPVELALEAIRKEPKLKLPQLTNLDKIASIFNIKTARVKEYERITETLKQREDKIKMLEKQLKTRDSSMKRREEVISRKESEADTARNDALRMRKEAEKLKREQTLSSSTTRIKLRSLNLNRASRSMNYAQKCKNLSATATK